MSTRHVPVTTILASGLLATTLLATTSCAGPELCEVAREHVEACAGPEEAADFATTCTDASAQRTIDTPCETPTAAPDKVDGWLTVKTVVDESAVIASPIEDVWARISDHASTHTWITDAQVTLGTRAPGDNPNGVGAVRIVKFPRSDNFGWKFARLDEQIMAFDPPRSFSYKIIKGLPGLADHLGTLTLEPIDAGSCKLTWHVDFTFSFWPKWYARKFTSQFAEVLRTGIANLAEQERG